jgi:hypothetical protein
MPSPDARSSSGGGEGGDGTIWKAVTRAGFQFLLKPLKVQVSLLLRV